jgi:hypothetical protein
MDLALATGRGEPLLTEWPNVEAPLVADADAIQVGDRETEPAEGSGTGTLEPSIAQFTVQEILRRGVARGVRSSRRASPSTRPGRGLAPRGPGRARPRRPSSGGFARQPGSGLRAARGSPCATRRHRPRDWARRHDLRPRARREGEIPAGHRRLPREWAGRKCGFGAHPGSVIPISTASGDPGVVGNLFALQRAGLGRGRPETAAGMRPYLAWVRRAEDLSRHCGLIRPPRVGGQLGPVDRRRASDPRKASTL